MYTKVAASFAVVRGLETFAVGGIAVAFEFFFGGLDLLAVLAVEKLCLWGVCAGTGAKSYAGGFSFGEVLCGYIRVRLGALRVWVYLRYLGGESALKVLRKRMMDRRRYLRMPRCTSPGHKCRLGDLSFEGMIGHARMC